jgi:hypothetical protein
VCSWQATCGASIPSTSGGVELGKRIAGDLPPAVAARKPDEAADPVTRALLAELNARR